MAKNPIVNAFSATGYILIVAGVLNLVAKTQANTPDTFFAPVAALSLLTLSAAVMAYLFFYQPLVLLIDGKKKKAVDFFFRTVITFGVITTVIWILVIGGII